MCIRDSFRSGNFKDQWIDMECIMGKCDDDVEYGEFEFLGDNGNNLGEMYNAPPPVALPEADDAVASKKRKVGETALAPTDSTAHLPRQPRGPIAETANAEDDGFRWSKCGQNTIEGAAFPRSFYRCISLRGSNCQCLKIIEGDPKDPGSGSVTYAGIHNHEPPQCK